MILHLLLAIVSGALFAFAFPSVAQGWLAFVALAPLLIAIVRAKNAKQAFLFGWISQATAWLIMVPWVVRVMSHYGGLPYAAGVAIFAAMSLYLGMYGGVFALLVYRCKLGARFLPWLLVPLAWAAVEYARTYLLSGFPWNLIATAMIDYTSLIQIDRFGGPYFVGALVVLPATVAAWWITQRPPGIQRVFVVGSLGILLMVWWGTGLVASKLLARPNASDPITAALLQPNITQQMRWDEANVIAIYQKMIAMTEDAANKGAKIVIWPESTVPLSYTETDFFRASIEELSTRYGIDIILGSVATDPKQPKRLWNSAFLVSNGTTIGHYDKIRLVPFGEYVPMRRVLFFAEKLVRAVGEFEFGTNELPLLGKLAYGPAICYEIVYPQITRTQVRNGATVIITITNDAWYDGTSAPAQHLWQARLRAVEGDRYILRAATTGISAFVDPTGRVLESIPMGREGIIYAKFQPRKTTTPYVRFGDWFAWMACAVVLIGIVRRRHIK
ncbi:MAG TPA: apolipoprotein N-acyltransferase [Thermoanaerobaculia bacterium]|jgi:apolipoprotein N-acyltransferase|nr:apolipoprotein N-acyltransferase [Thermoanaerobaculia bacterium]